MNFFFTASFVSGYTTERFCEDAVLSVGFADGQRSHHLLETSKKQEAVSVLLQTRTTETTADHSEKCTFEQTLKRVNL